MGKRTVSPANNIHCPPCWGPWSTRACHPHPCRHLESQAVLVPLRAWDPCWGIFLYADLQQIHLFMAALHPPHTNWMVYKIQTAASESQGQELKFSKTQSLPIPQCSTRRPSGDISALWMTTVVRAGKPLGRGKRRDGCLATHSSLAVTKQQGFS